MLLDGAGLYYYKYYVAFLFKRPSSKLGHAGFIDAQGHRRNRSTGSANRKEAQRIADAFEETTRKKRTARHVLEIMSELHEEITGETLRSHTFRQFAETWLKGKATVSKATQVFYKNAVAKFIAFLGAKGEAQMTDITRDDITNFRNQEAKTLSAKTVSHHLKCLRMLFRSAREDRVISEDPCEFVKTPKKGTTLQRRPFTIPEVQAVLAVADEEWKSLILFGILTG